MESKYYREHFWGVSQIQAVYQEREAQIGVNTSNGFFLSEDPELLFEGDRTVAVLFTTGPNDSTVREQIFCDNSNSAQSGTGAWLNNQYLYVSYKGSTQVEIAKVDVNTTYLLIITKEKAYLNGIKYKLNTTGTQNTEFIVIGASKSGANAFKGVVHNSRIFNYIFSDSDADKLWNNANPMAYMLPNEGTLKDSCVAEYLSQNLVQAQNSIAKVWINSAQESSHDMTYVEPILDNLDSSNLNVGGSPTILYNEEVYYGIEWHISASDPHCTRIGNLELHKTLPIQNKMRGCILNETGNVVTYLNPTDWTADSTARDGSTGDVMVEIPSHYRKFETIGDVCRCKISEYPLPGYHNVPKMYISAYEATVQRSTSKLCSVVNTTEDYRGGNNNSAWDGTYRSFLGLPATAISRTNFRNYARNKKSGSTEWNCLDYNAYKAVFWLYYVEYANRNCQSTFIAEKDANGFAQGGLGAGVTNATSTKWSAYNSYYPFIPCGYTDELGNGTGEVEFTMPQEYDTETLVVKVPRYRGIENPFGHLWKWMDGINIQIASADDGGTSKVWVSSDPSKYNDSNYDGYEIQGEEARTGGYTKTLVFGENGDIIPATVVRDYRLSWMDYHYTQIPPSLVVLRGIMLGGYGSSGSNAGFTCVNSNFSPLGADAYLGTRLCFIPQQK